MPTWAKVLLAVGCGLVLLIVAAALVGGYFFVRGHKEEWMAEGKKARDEGAAFAAGKSANDCVDESLRQLRATSGLMAEVRVRVFLQGCLEHAEPSPQLCAGVPARTEIIRTARWSLDECSRRGMAGSQPCSRVMQEVQRYCERSPR